MSTISISLNTRNAVAYLKRISRNGPAKSNFLQEVGITGSEMLRAEAAKNHLTGNAERSIDFRKNTVRDEVAITSGSRYITAEMEDGRKPGKWPPKGALNVFVYKRFGYAIGTSKNKSLSFLIARKIKKVGTKKFRTKGPKQITKTARAIKSKLPTLLKKYLRLYD